VLNQIKVGFEEQGNRIEAGEEQEKGMRFKVRGKRKFRNEERGARDTEQDGTGSEAGGSKTNFGSTFFSCSKIILHLSSSSR